MSNAKTNLKVVTKIDTKASAKARERLLKTVKVLGNSNYGLGHRASDLLNEAFVGNPKARKKAATEMFLGDSTVTRVMDDGGSETYRPQGNTLERIFIYFDQEIEFNTVRIKPRYQNKPKVDSQTA